MTHMTLSCFCCVSRNAIATRWDVGIVVSPCRHLAVLAALHAPCVCIQVKTSAISVQLMIFDSRSLRSELELSSLQNRVDSCSPRLARWRVQIALFVVFSCLFGANIIIYES